MRKPVTMEVTRETSQLLSELDLAIDQSGVMREIISKYDRIRSIENITGPSRLTRTMRKETRIMENRLRTARLRGLKQYATLSSIYSEPK